MATKQLKKNAEKMKQYCDMIVQYLCSSVQYEQQYNASMHKLFLQHLMKIVQGGPIKNVHFEIQCLFLQMWTDFQFFHQVIRTKILCTHHRFPPDLQYVATLPCKVENPNMLPNFHVERDDMVKF